MRVKPERILCATDFSATSNHALPYGIALAREFGAKLYVCHVIDLSFIGLYDTTAFALTSTEQELISYAREEISRLMGEPAIDWEPLILEGQPAMQIARAVEEHDIDLVITATHGRSGLTRLLIGSVTERLLRTLNRPLLVVRSPEHDFVAPAGDHIQLRRILVGCDFSPHSRLAIDYGLSLAQEFEAEIHLMHVLEPSLYESLTRPSTGLTEELQQAVRAALERKLRTFVPEEAQAWSEVKTVIGVGHPHRELTQYAVEHEVDLIVLGVRGHSLVEELFVGSTTDRVIRQAPCPVLAVRAPTHSAPSEQEKSEREG